MSTDTIGTKALIVIPRDPRNGRPLVTSEMKAECIGEFTFYRTEMDEDGAEVDAEIIVPWDTCKKIYKAMAEAASRPVADRLAALEAENGRLRALITEFAAFARDSSWPNVAEELERRRDAITGDPQ